MSRSSSSNEQLLDNLHETLARDPSLARSIARIVAQHQRHSGSDYTVSEAGEGEEGGPTARSREKGKRREQQWEEDDYGHTDSSDEGSDLDSSEESSAEERRGEAEGRPLISQERLGRTRTKVSSRPTDRPQERRNHRHASRPRSAPLSRPSDLPNSLNPSAYIPIPLQTDHHSSKHKKKPLIVLPFVVPTFGRDGLPVTPNNPYLPPPALLQESKRHRARLYLAQPLASTFKRGEGEGDPKNSFFFPFLIGLLLVVLPMTVLGLVMALLIDWRGGVEAGWSGNEAVSAVRR